MMNKNRKKQIHKCDYCCNNKATYKVYENYIDSYIYLCKDCYEKMNEDEEEYLTSYDNGTY